MKYVGSLILILFAFTAAAQTHEVTISIVTDYETVVYYGSPEVTRSVINTRMERVTEIYQRELDLKIDVVLVDIPRSPSEDNVATHTHAHFLLESLKEFKADTSHSETGLMMLLTTRDLAQGYIGLAPIKAVCSTHAVGIAHLSSDEVLDYSLIAHEMGHILGANHDGATTGSCPTESEYQFIMSARINSADTFSECSKDRMKEFYTTRECVKLPTVIVPTVVVPTVPTVTTPTPSKSSSGGGGSFDLLLIVILGFSTIKARSRIAQR